MKEIAKKKTRIRNLQFGPKTRQIRGIFFEIQNFLKEGKCVHSPRVSQLPGMKEIAKKKTRIRNLQFGPKTRQIRGIYFLKFKIFQKKEMAFILPELVSYRG